MQVFTAQAADGVSTTFEYLFGYKPMNIMVNGALGGGTVTLEAQTPDGLSWVPVSGVSFTASGMEVFESFPFVGRLVLTGATTPSVDAWVEGQVLAV